MSDVSRRPERLAWVASLIGLFLLVLGGILCRTADSTAMVPACIASVVIMLISGVSGARARFARRQKEEEAGFEEHRRESANADLFEDSDEASKLAARTNRHFVRFFVPFATATLGLGVVLAVALNWGGWNDALTFPEATLPLRYASLSLALALVSVIGGSYFVGVSREAGCRWIRPCGAWMFLAAGLFLLSGIALVGEHAQVAIERLDVRAAKIGAAALLVLGLELIANFIIEFYRPRTPGEAERPLYESRILALFTEPGGIARNVALSLDYQFGFRVSEVWFYRFLERTLVPFAMVMAACLWLQTCIVVVNTEENGIRERFGRVVDRTPLKPDIYFKLPAPFARIYKFPVERVQRIPIGYIPGTEDDPTLAAMDPELQGDMTGRVIVWSKIHAKEETDFVVACDPELADEDPDQADSPGALPVTVYFLSANFPLYFKVRNLYEYAYGHQDALHALEKVATREVVRYLANVDFFKILTVGRAEGAKELQRRIQLAADGLNLGVDIVFVGLQGLHPPVTVGSAFDEVVAAMEEKHEEALKAERYAIKTQPAAEGQAVTLTAQAEAYRQNRVRVAEAEAERFTKQLLAYDASPKLFVLRSFLDVLENEGAPARKYVVAAEGGAEVFIINLEEKQRVDLLEDLDLDQTDQE